MLSIPAARLGGFLLSASLFGCATAEEPPRAEVQPAPEVICAPTNEIANRLLHQFGEVLAAVGVTSEGKLMMAFISRTGGWTLVLAESDERACVLSTGGRWRPVRVTPKGVDS